MSRCGQRAAGRITVTRRRARWLGGDVDGMLRRRLPDRSSVSVIAAMLAGGLEALPSDERRTFRRTRGQKRSSSQVIRPSSSRIWRSSFARSTSPTAAHSIAYDASSTTPGGVSTSGAASPECCGPRTRSASRSRVSSTSEPSASPSSPAVAARGSAYHSGRRPDRRASAASASSFDRGVGSGAQPALGLLGAPEREAQDLDRVPGAQRHAAVVARRPVDRPGNGPVQRPQRPLERLGAAFVRVQQRRAHGHALREGLPRRSPAAGRRARAPERSRSAAGSRRGRPSGSRRAATRTRRRQPG